LKKCSLILLCLFILLNYKLTHGQPLSRCNTFNYSLNEGLLQTTILDMEFDGNNFLWISFPNGIQRYDGKNFIYIPVQKGLPEITNCTFFRCRDGNLLISHFKGISKYERNGNKFTEIYTYAEAVKTPSEFIGESDGVIYFHTDAAEIIGINADSFTFHSRFKTGLPDYKTDFNFNPKISDNIIDGKTALLINKKIYTWDLKKGELLFQSVTIPEISSYLLKQISKNEILFYTYKPKGTLQILNTETSTVRLLRVEGQEQVTMGRCIVYEWQSKILLSINDRIYVTDPSFQNTKAEIVNYQNKAPANGAGIQQIKSDNFGNLFVRTINNGIRKIMAANYPLKYYTTGAKEKNFILSLLADKEKNRILAGAANNGLFVFDTSQQLIKHLPIPVSPNRQHSPNTIIKSPAGDYFVLTSGTFGVWKLSIDLKSMKLISPITDMPREKANTGYFCKLLYSDREQAVVVSETKIIKITFADSKVYVYPSANGYIMSGVYSNPYFILHYNDEFIFLDKVHFKIVKRIPFKNTGGVRCYLTDNTGKIYTGTNKGIFITDTSGSIHKKINKESGLPDECIYAMAWGTDSSIWCSTNKGLVRLKRDNNLMQLKKEDGLQENEFNTNVVTSADDGELFFGGVNGFSSFFPNQITGTQETIRIFFTKIMANNRDAVTDTAAWNIDKIVLPYTENTLSFDFTAMGLHNADQYIYQYRMVGVDKEWIMNNGMQTARYSLQPGKYTFQIYASRSFNADAQPLKEITIIIREPFWKSSWFLAGTAFLTIVLIAYFLNEKNKRSYEKKLQQLKNEKQLKEERERISRDLHDNLGAYANAVLYNTELLENEKEEQKRLELIGDIKFASKDIITSLRETVWALKKETYTAEECFVRIKNFIQPLSRYYSHIHFINEGTAPDNMQLHYTKALALVRIVQEATANAIKHSGAKNISIHSTAGEDNRWVITVTDDGRGFNYKEARTGDAGNGLTNMENRAAEANFGYKIDPGNGTGTVITLII
jgi:signal transduction histidine kinase